MTGSMNDEARDLSLGGEPLADAAAVPAPDAAGGQPAADAGPVVDAAGAPLPQPAAEELLPPAAPIDLLGAPEPASLAAMALPEPLEPASAVPAPPLETPHAGAALPGPGPVDATTLVPLEDIAPAIAAASVSRRAFIGFGLALAGGLAGAAGLSRLFPVFEDTSAASPIVPAYDPAGKAWTFVVDTASCIGCGMCVAACKEENHVPEEAAYTRTWIERHTVTADGALYVDSPDAGINGFPPESTAPGAAGKTTSPVGECAITGYLERHDARRRSKTCCAGRLRPR